MIKIQGFDLLRQYISVSRTVADNYIQDVQSNVLQQYFMVSFTYFLNKFGGNSGKGEKRQPYDGLSSGEVARRHETKRLLS